MAFIARWLRRFSLLLLGLAVLIALYVGTAFALVFWPSHAKATAPAAPYVEAWVLSNGVHTDYVFPVRSALIDWQKLFPLADFPAVPPGAEYVALGWGDREFYLHTPTWADLTAARALGALSGRNRALLHVSYLRRDQFGAGAFRLPLSMPQYLRLIEHVRSTLPAGQATAIAGAHYNAQDAFYEANGAYHLFETCNTWTGRGLRRAGVTVSRWTPFDFAVTWHLQPAP